MTADAWGAVWSTCYDDYVYVPNLKRFASKQEVGHGQVLDSLRLAFGQAQGQLAKEMKKVEKAEGKLKLVTAGFEKRAATALEQLHKRSADRDEKYVHEVFFVIVHARSPFVVCLFVTISCKVPVSSHVPGCII